MRFINASYEEFLRRKGDRGVIHFGASSAWHYYLKIFPGIPSEVLEGTLFIVDNDPDKQGKEFEVGGRRFCVKGAEALAEARDCVLLITVSLAYQERICEQLMGLSLPEDMECYSLPLMITPSCRADNRCVEEYFERHTAAINAPKIHCFWFSGEEKPELYRRCMDSWRRHCPEFEIMEWNARNYDVTKNRYMKEAFGQRKWAFVSDYARLDAVYRYGGIYMDLDVELTAPLAPLLSAGSFFCRQEDGLIDLGSGFGARAGDPLIGELLGTYRDRGPDTTPQPEWLCDVFEKHGISRGFDSQASGERLVLSNDYIMCFSGEDPVQIAKLGVHWHNGGWLDEKDRRLIRDSFRARDGLVGRYFRKEA